MGYDMRLRDGNGEIPDGIYSFGSALALVELCDWIATLPEHFALLHEFAREDTVTGTMDFSIELEDALKEFPADEGVTALVTYLLERIGDGDDNETLTVGQDLGDDDDDDNDDEAEEDDDDSDPETAD